jgi:hypothetical protein
MWALDPYTLLKVGQKRHKMRKADSPPPKKKIKRQFAIREKAVGSMYSIYMKGGTLIHLMQKGAVPVSCGTLVGDLNKCKPSYSA